MKIGISPNYLKSDIISFVNTLIAKLQKANVDFVLSDLVLKIKGIPKGHWEKYQLVQK